MDQVQYLLPENIMKIPIPAIRAANQTTKDGGIRQTKGMWARREAQK